MARSPSDLLGFHRGSGVEGKARKDSDEVAERDLEVYVQGLLFEFDLLGEFVHHLRQIVEGVRELVPRRHRPVAVSGIVRCDHAVLVAECGLRLRNIWELVGKPCRSKMAGASLGPASRNTISRSPTFTDLWNTFTGAASAPLAGVPQVRMEIAIEERIAARVVIVSPGKRERSRSRVTERRECWGGPKAEDRVRARKTCDRTLGSSRR